MSEYWVQFLKALVQWCSWLSSIFSYLINGKGITLECLRSGPSIASTVHTWDIGSQSKPEFETCGLHFFFPMQLELSDTMIPVGNAVYSSLRQSPLRDAMGSVA